MLYTVTVWVYKNTTHLLGRLLKIKITKDNNR